MVNKETKMESINNNDLMHGQLDSLKAPTVLSFGIDGLSCSFKPLPRKSIHYSLSPSPRTKRSTNNKNGVKSKGLTHKSIKSIER